jgi:hypothetical protein
MAEMVTAPEVIRILLLLCVMGMALIALFYLRRRNLSVREFTLWGLLALFIPILGPLIVITLRPGGE